MYCAHIDCEVRVDRPEFRRRRPVLTTHTDRLCHLLKPTHSDVLCNKYHHSLQTETAKLAPEVRAVATQPASITSTALSPQSWVSWSASGCAARHRRHDADASVARRGRPNSAAARSSASSSSHTSHGPAALVSTRITPSRLSLYLPCLPCLLPSLSLLHLPVSHPTPPDGVILVRPVLLAGLIAVVLLVLSTSVRDSARASDAAAQASPVHDRTSEPFHSAAVVGELV